MRILSLYSSKNVHGNDAGGAFIPQAVGFAKARKAAGDAVESVPFDPTLPVPERRKAVIAAIRAAQPFDALVYFGHGLRTGLPSAGFGTDTLPLLVDAIHARASQRLMITLYACSTAGAPGRDRERLGGDGGYADRLRDSLASAGHTGWVDAHDRPGHTTINRYTRRFTMDAGPAVGGEWIVTPGGPEWKAWGERLKGDQAFRFGFPFMDRSAILAALR